jgi:hypothetical protein
VDDAVTEVKSWFSGRQGPWLMVFDGADSIDNSQSSGYINMEHFIPNATSLHVIVTSRSSTTKDMTRAGRNAGWRDERGVGRRAFLTVLTATPQRRSYRG